MVYSCLVLALFCVPVLHAVRVFHVIHDRTETKGCSYRKLEEGSVIKGYEIHDCLGSGGYGEAYLVTKGGVQKVMKVGTISEEECQYGREMSKLAKDYFTNCTDYGNYSDGKMFLILEFAPGQELTKVINSHVKEPPPQLNSLTRVLKTLKTLVDLVELMINTSHFYEDLHSNNILIAENSKITIIDYGRGCLPGSQNDWCDPEESVIRMHWYVFFNLIEMLVQPTVPSSFPPMVEALLFAYASPDGMEDANKAASEAATDMVKFMRPAYELAPGSTAAQTLSEMLRNGFLAIQRMGTFERSWDLIVPLLKQLQ